MSIQTGIINSTVKKAAKGILSIKVEGRWNVDELNVLLTSLNILYFVATCMNQKGEDEFGGNEDYLRSFNIGGFELAISQKIPDLAFVNVVAKEGSEASEITKKKAGFEALQIHELKFSPSGNFSFLGKNNALKSVFSLIQYYLENTTQKADAGLDQVRSRTEKIKILKQANVREESIKRMLFLEDKSLLNMAYLMDKRMIIAVAYIPDNSDT